MRKVLFFAVAALVGFASCQKEAGVASGDFPDGGEYEIVFEELEGDGTKAAITEVYLDTKGDLAAKSQTLTARLQNKTTKAKISADSYTWSVNCGDAVKENVDRNAQERNTLTAMEAGTGKVSVSATYKGQSVTSSDVPVTVTESEIESIRLLGNTANGFRGPEGIGSITDDGRFRGRYDFWYARYPYLCNFDEISQNPRLLFCYDSQIDLPWDGTKPVDGLGGISKLISDDIIPPLFLFVKVKYKGMDLTKEKAIADGVEYDFIDEEGNYNIKPGEPSMFIASETRDLFIVDLPDQSSTHNGYNSKYFGEHVVKASYKGFEDQITFSIDFDMEGFNYTVKDCSMNAWYDKFIGRGCDEWLNQEDGDNHFVSGANYDTYGIVYNWGSLGLTYVLQRNRYLNGLETHFGESIILTPEFNHEGNNSMPTFYVEAEEKSGYLNYFKVYFQNWCLTTNGIGIL